jgi:hypothetical protein
MKSQGQAIIYFPGSQTETCRRGGINSIIPLTWSMMTATGLLHKEDFDGIFQRANLHPTCGEHEADTTFGKT